MTQRFFLVVLSLIFTPALLLAAPKGSVEVSPLDVFTATSGSTTATCALINGAYVPGAYVKRSTTTFLPRSAKIKNLKKKKRKITNSVKRAKLSKKIRKAKKQKKAEEPICIVGPGGTPTPSPGSNCDSFGNLTTAGKTAFGIPSHLDANINTGKNVQQNKCSGCHGERTGRSFSNLRSNTSQSPMFYNTTTLPDTELAHLTAYLNRFFCN